MLAAAAPIFAAALAIPPFETPETPQARVESCWAAIAAAPDGEAPDCLEGFVSGLAPRVFGDGWSGLSERERGRFVHALTTAVGRGLPRGAAIDRVSVDGDARSQRLVYRVGESDQASLLFLRPGSEPRGGALDASLVDVRWNDVSLVDRYRRDGERLRDRYSFAYLVGELEGRGVIVLEDFEDGPLEGLPRGWKWRGWGRTDEKPYRVLEEGGNRFLRAEDRGENVMLYKETRWDAKKYPYFAFRLRIRAVPEGGDERFEERADNAAGVYLSYDRRLGLVPETVKFVWSQSLDAGTAFRRPGIGMPWTVVAGRGGPDPDRWQELVFDIGEIYEKTFGRETVERPLGIGVLTDANNTSSFAAADYDDFRALSKTDAPLHVREILELPPN